MPHVPDHLPESDLVVLGAGGVKPCPLPGDACWYFVCFMDMPAATAAAATAAATAAAAATAGGRV